MPVAQKPSRVSRIVYSNSLRNIRSLRPLFSSLDNDDETFVAKKERLKPKIDAEAICEFLFPFLTPLLAYHTYELVATGYSDFVEIMSNTNWVPVDGGAFQAKIIAPAINGLVAPAISILYATLTSTTISTLRQRQVDIRRSINMEAGELRNLGHLVYSYPPGSVRSMCRVYLTQYTNRIIRECQSTKPFAPSDTFIDPGHGMDTELNGFSIQMHEGYEKQIPTFLGAETFAAIARLRGYRLERITALQCTYPVLHYIFLALLALAECTIFLMETNQDVLYFLNAFQLKILWSIMIGTFAVCFTIFYDFESPFAGSYQISASVDQLHFIRKSLEAFDKIEKDLTTGPADGTITSSLSTTSTQTTVMTTTAASSSLSSSLDPQLQPYETAASYAPINTLEETNSSNNVTIVYETLNGVTDKNN